jgi:hypothetical protein
MSSRFVSHESVEPFDARVEVVCEDTDQVKLAFIDEEVGLPATIRVTGYAFVVSDMVFVVPGSGALIAGVGVNPRGRMEWTIWRTKRQPLTSSRDISLHHAIRTERYEEQYLSPHRLRPPSAGRYEVPSAHGLPLKDVDAVSLHRA